MIILKSLLIFLFSSNINVQAFQTNILQSEKSKILMNTSNFELITCPDLYDISNLKAKCCNPDSLLLICESSCSMNLLDDINNISCNDNVSYGWFCISRSEEKDPLGFSDSTRKPQRNSTTGKFFDGIIFKYIFFPFWFFLVVLAYFLSHKKFRAKLTSKICSVCKPANQNSTNLSIISNQIVSTGENAQNYQIVSHLPPKYEQLTNLSHENFINQLPSYSECAKNNTKF